MSVDYVLIWVLAGYSFATSESDRIVKLYQAFVIFSREAAGIISENSKKNGWITVWEAVQIKAF